MARKATAQERDGSGDALAWKPWTPAAAKPKDWIPILAELPLFSGLGKRQLRRLADLAEPIEYSAGDIITEFGEAGDAFYVVLSGRARALGERGARRVFRPGDFFGEMALLDGEPRSATVTAATELHALRLRHRPFCKLLEKEPKMAIVILRELSRRIRTLQRQVVQ